VAGWEDLKNRLDRDRRVYALFHPLVPDEPLVFVEVALTSGLASEISTLLDPSEVVDDPETATSAIFYSISNTQPGLAGINIGAQLVKSVISALARELPRLRTFATLSPLPGFRPWAEHNAGYTPQAFATLANSALGDSSAARKAIVELCAIYLLQAKRPDGRALDPVANFHLSNGARMEQINWLADASPRCLKSSVGLMVTYVYRPNEIADNAARYEADGIVAAAGQWRRLASSPAEPVPAASKARSAR
jgi:malonyl-CoA decarboxylase